MIRVILCLVKCETRIAQCRQQGYPQTQLPHRTYGIAAQQRKMRRQQKLSGCCQLKICDTARHGAEQGLTTAEVYMNKLRFRWAYISRAETTRTRGDFGRGGVCVDKGLHDSVLFLQRPAPCAHLEMSSCRCRQFG